MAPAMTEIPTPSVGDGASRTGWIRTIAIGVLIWRDHLLGQRGYDHVKRETFFRPLNRWFQLPRGSVSGLVITHSPDRA